jgi:hypothetical protein
MYYATLRFLIFFLSASKCDKENTLRYALMTENTPNCVFKVIRSHMWNCFCLLEGRNISRENNNGMDTEAGLKELFLARSQHSGYTVFGR